MIEQGLHTDRLTGVRKFFVGKTSYPEGHSGLNREPV